MCNRRQPQAAVGGITECNALNKIKAVFAFRQTLHKIFLFCDVDLSMSQNRKFCVKAFVFLVNHFFGRRSRRSLRSNGSTKQFMHIGGGCACIGAQPAPTDERHKGGGGACKGAEPAPEPTFKILRFCMLHQVALLIPLAHMLKRSLMFLLIKLSIHLANSNSCSVSA